jgi:hypothetical protein
MYVSLFVNTHKIAFYVSLEINRKSLFSFVLYVHKNDA